jgi:hypothetical protein
VPCHYRAAFPAGLEVFNQAAWTVRVGLDWSGREDLNLRPPAPKAGALPGCATPRHSTSLILNCFSPSCKAFDFDRGRTGDKNVMRGRNRDKTPEVAISVGYGRRFGRQAGQRIPLSVGREFCGAGLTNRKTMIPLATNSSRAPALRAGEESSRLSHSEPGTWPDFPCEELLLLYHQ